VTFSYGFDDENIKIKRHNHVRFILSDIILAQWRHPVASSKALDLFHWAMRAVLYRLTAAAINMATFLGVFVGCCLFACCSGGCWGNMEQVVARWRHPVASEVALDMPHWAMPSVFAPAHPQGLRNGPQWRCILMSSLILSLTITMAK
jgi:hypothetical protein